MIASGSGGGQRRCVASYGSGKRLTDVSELTRRVASDEMVVGAVRHVAIPVVELGQHDAFIEHSRLEEPVERRPPRGVDRMLEVRGQERATERRVRDHARLRRRCTLGLNRDEVAHDHQDRGSRERERKAGGDREAEYEARRVSRDHGYGGLIPPSALVAALAAASTTAFVVSAAGLVAVVTVPITVSTTGVGLGGGLGPGPGGGGGGGPPPSVGTGLGVSPLCFGAEGVAPPPRVVSLGCPWGSVAAGVGSAALRVAPWPAALVARGEIRDPPEALEPTWPIACSPGTRTIEPCAGARLASSSAFESPNGTSFAASRSTVAGSGSERPRAASVGTGRTTASTVNTRAERPRNRGRTASPVRCPIAAVMNERVSNPLGANRRCAASPRVLQMGDRSRQAAEPE